MGVKLDDIIDLFNELRGTVVYYVDNVHVPRTFEGKPVAYALPVPEEAVPLACPPAVLFLHPNNLGWLREHLGDKELRRFDNWLTAIRPSLARRAYL
jgi:hypothetical protein